MIPAQVYCFPEAVPYARAVTLQESLVAQRIQDRIPDTILLLQHPPVITLGRRGRREHLLASPGQLEAAGVELHLSARGGDVTFHGPGQWVLYPILKLSAREMGTHGYLHALEEIALQTAAAFGIPAFRREGKAGAWCEQGKFSAIGFKFTRWVSWHGLSLNVRPDLHGFDLIHGCGLVGEPVTSFQAVLQADCPEMPAAAEVLLAKTAAVLQRQLTPRDPAGLPGN